MCYYLNVHFQGQRVSPYISVTCDSVAIVEYVKFIYVYACNFCDEVEA